MATHHHNEDYQKIIRLRGFRVTPQRQLILEAVRGGKGHSTPEQVYNRVVRKAPALNRATVYRTLEFLAEQHLITSTDVGTGGKVYEIAEPLPHHHLVCEKCGKVEQVGHSIVERTFRQVEREYGFKVTSNHLALFGICKSCQGQ
jgi:Fur family ferric uptake transcriptional regulator